MDRRIDLRSKSDSIGATGQPLKTWSTLATVWANKRDLSGSEKNRGGEEVATQKTVFTIRYRADVNTTNRITHDSTEYDVFFTKELGRTQFLELHSTGRTDG